MIDFRKTYHRQHNFYRVRQLTTNNSTGDAFGITIPRSIATQFLGVKLRFILTENGFNYVISGGNL